jgi:hypothetical protein
MVSIDYEDDVAFLAVAWKGSFERTLAKANELLGAGAIQWGLDAEEAIFEAYGIPYQPVTVMIFNGVIVDQWSGALGEDGVRDKLDTLTSYG